MDKGEVFYGILILIAIIAVTAWFLLFPLNPPFVWEAIAVKGLLLVVAVFSLFFILRLQRRGIEIGFGILIIGLLIDLLDEFTAEPAIVSTQIGGALKVLGFSIIAAGIYISTKNLESALRISRRKGEESTKSEEKYRRLTEDINDVVCEMDEHDTLTYVSPKIQDLLGYQPEEMVGRTIFDHMTSDQRAYATTFFDTMAYARDSFALFEHEMLHRDGHTVAVQTNGTPIFTAKGTFVGYRIVCRDITLHKRAEEEVERRNKQLSIINEIIGTTASSLTLHDLMKTSLAKTIDLLDFDAGMIYLMDRDRKRAELKVYQGFADWVIPEEKTIDMYSPPYAQVFSAGIPHFIENYRERYPDREEFGILSFASIPLMAHARVVGVMNIASKRHYSFSPDEKEILWSIGREIGGAVLKEMLNQELSDAGVKAQFYVNQVEAANNEANLYLDIMTHDINNANMVTLSYADLLDDATGSATGEYIQKLQKSVQKSIEIIRNVSTIRKLHREKASLTPVDLDAVIRAELEHHAGAAITYEGGPCTVLADDLLPEIFTNLIGNSIKFGGRDVTIRIHTIDTGDEVLVSVEDTGPGISNALKPLIFNRFQRGSAKVPGMGLGLSITQMLMERYGGRIWAEDRVPGHSDEGTAIKFVLAKTPHT
jgi:PAS domain S-box-containing protein